MAAQTDAETLQLRMQRIRNRMHAKVDGLRLDAENLLDWRYYVCQFPWSSALAAAAVGFWLTPGHRVTPTVKLDNRTIDNLIDRGVMRVEMPPPPPTAPWWRPLTGMALNFLGKAALAYVGQQFVRQEAAATAADVAETRHDSARR
jgi:hypothetical protein